MDVILPHLILEAYNACRNDEITLTLYKGLQNVGIQFRIGLAIKLAIVPLKITVF